MQTILDNLVDKQMSEYLVEDGAEFTVVLVSSK
jgi:hypothetical protein